MRIVAIGDIHGYDVWADIIKKEDDGKTTFVFVGDYFDDFHVPFTDQLYNFKQIVYIQKKLGKNRVKLLIGNHDYHYMDGVNDGPYSGYQKDHKIEIRNAITEALPGMQFAYEYNNVLFTHAGVGREWLVKQGIPIAADIINKLPLDAFKFTPAKMSDYYGNTITQTPIWIRPDALYQVRNIGKIQVVGHTKMGGIVNMDNLWFIDALAYKQYLVIEDNVFIAKVL